MITVIIPEWLLWIFIGMIGVSIILQIIGIILKAARLQVVRATKTISDEIIEKYGQLL